MASTTFVDYSQNTPITAAWLNDVNNDTYNTDGSVNKSNQQAFAWVRFNGTTGGIVSQSSNVQSVTRTGTGVYVIAYTVTLPQATNCYGVSTNLVGFSTISAETVNSVTISCVNALQVASDPTLVSVQIWANH